MHGLDAEKNGSSSRWNVFHKNSSLIIQSVSDMEGQSFWKAVASPVPLLLQNGQFKKTVQISFCLYFPLDSTKKIACVAVLYDKSKLFSVCTASSQGCHTKKGARKLLSFYFSVAIMEKENRSHSHEVWQSDSACLWHKNRNFGLKGENSTAIYTKHNVALWDDSNNCLSFLFQYSIRLPGHL